MHRWNCAKKVPSQKPGVSTTALGNPLVCCMDMLKEKSKNIQSEAFHVFKGFVANPNKPKAITEILLRNRDRLVEFLIEFHIHQRPNMGMPPPVGMPPQRFPVQPSKKAVLQQMPPQQMPKQQQPDQSLAAPSNDNLDEEQQAQMLVRVLQLTVTDEQIWILPPTERAQVIELRNQLRNAGAIEEEKRNQ